MLALSLWGKLCLALILASAVTSIAAAGDVPFQRPIYDRPLVDALPIGVATLLSALRTFW